MLTAVCLDRQPTLNAVEVEHIRPKRMLTAELGAGQLAAAKQTPQGVFGVCGIRTEPAG